MSLLWLYKEACSVAVQHPSHIPGSCGITAMFTQTWQLWKESTQWLDHLNPSSSNTALTYFGKVAHFDWSQNYGDHNRKEWSRKRRRKKKKTCGKILKWWLAEAIFMAGENISEVSQQSGCLKEEEGSLWSWSPRMLEISSGLLRLT